MKSKIKFLLHKVGLGEINWVLFLVVMAITALFMISGWVISIPLVSMPILTISFLPPVLQLSEAFTKSKPIFKEEWDYEKYGKAYSYNISARIVLATTALLYMLGTLVLMSYVLA
jgi:hypothetical protein